MKKNNLLMILIFILIIPFVNLAHEKWIVVTTINYPTPALKKLAQLKDWHLVVVGDKKTPKDWYLENCDFLSEEKQEQLDYAIIKHLPWNHYSRKNIGYLYAIEHGARIIYETDDDNVILGDTINFLPEHISCMQAKSLHGLVNPYAYFGQPTVWPRGYPLRHILSPTTSEIIAINRSWVPIQQGLVNGDTDVDAIFRLTRNNNNLTFQSNKLPLTIAHKTMTPFNTQNTLFYYDAFWGLLVPISVSFRVSDIWRGYWMQRLLWDLGGHLCFIAPTATQDRNDHDLLKDFIDEADLYTKAEDLIQFLTTWQSTEKRFENRFSALMEALIEHQFFKIEELNLVQAWLKDLKKCGYNMPKINSFS